MVDPVPYVDVATLRTLRGELTPTNYSDELLAGLVAEFEPIVERARGVANRSRTRTIRPRLERKRGVLVMRLRDVEVTAVTAITSGGVPVADPQTAEIIPDQLGDLVTYAPLVISPAPTITYQHGHPEPSPGLVRACALYVWHEALAWRTPDAGNAYVTATQDVAGNQFVQRRGTADPAAGRFTGWLDVDKLINAEPDRRPRGLS